MARFYINPNKVPFFEKGLVLDFDQWNNQKFSIQEITIHGAVIGYQLTKNNNGVAILKNIGGTHLPHFGQLPIPSGTYQVMFPFPGQLRLYKKPSGFQGRNIVVVK